MSILWVSMLGGAENPGAQADLAAGARERKSPARPKLRYPIADIALCLILALLFFSCGAPLTKLPTRPGVYHQVKAGETLWAIAQAYQVKIQELAQANQITPPESLEAGRVIFIPGARVPLDVAAQTPKEQVRVPQPAPPSPPLSSPPGDARPGQADQGGVSTGKTGEEPAVVRDESAKPQPRTISQIPRTRDEEALPIDKKRFIWPLKGELKSRFGMQPSGMFFNGIKIAAREGSPVLAAAGGTVVFSATLKDYGETIIIRHDELFATVYTNLGSRLVKLSAQVKSGEQIALLEGADRKGEAILSFEIRYKNKAYNPMLFLP